MQIYYTFSPPPQERDSQNGLMGKRGNAGVFVPQIVSDEVDEAFKRLGTPMSMGQTQEEFREDSSNNWGKICEAGQMMTLDLSGPLDHIKP